jgi:hypothetical protein
MNEEKKGESIVIKPREPFSDVILSENADELARFMDEPLSAIAESITGALAAGPKHWTVMTGHIVQAMLKGKLLQQVSREIKELRDEGKIPNDFAEKKYGFQSWVELLATIDEEAPDEDKVDALKAMFYGVNKIGIDDSERVLGYQLFQIAKKLSSNQLLVLKAVFESYKGSEFPNSDRVTLRGWAEKMAKRAGHGLVSLVLKDEPALVEQGLINPKLYAPNQPNSPENVFVEMLNARITDLGARFCQNIETYHSDVKP